MYKTNSIINIRNYKRQLHLEMLVMYLNHAKKLGE